MRKGAARGRCGVFLPWAVSRRRHPTIFFTISSDSVVVNFSFIHCNGASMFYSGYSGVFGFKN